MKYKLAPVPVTKFDYIEMILYLNNYKIDTTWIEEIAVYRGLGIEWGMKRCTEILNQYSLKPPKSLERLYLPDTNKPVSSYYNSVPTNTGQKFF